MERRKGRTFTWIWQNGDLCQYGCFPWKWRTDSDQRNVWKKSVSHFFQKCCNRHRGRSLLNQVTSSWFAGLHMFYMVAKHWLRKSTQPRTICHSSYFCFSMRQNRMDTRFVVYIQTTWCTFCMHLRATRAVTRPFLKCCKFGLLSSLSLECWNSKKILSLHYKQVDFLQFFKLNHLGKRGTFLNWVTCDNQWKSFNQSIGTSPLLSTSMTNMSSLLIWEGLNIC